MLTIVPTPIGNLQDITPRCLDALRDADVILCEDTRRSLKLVFHFGLKKPRLQRYNEHDERSFLRAMELLRSGKKTVLVTDSGTPCISDPGWKLVDKARENAVPVETLPGPCAAAAAAAGSGFPVDSFVFLGFLPRSESRKRRALKEAFALGKTVIIYESPYRIVKLLDSISKELGPGTVVAVARELTKVHEEWLRGTAEYCLKELSGRREVKGEIVVIIRGHRENKNSGH